MKKYLFIFVIAILMANTQEACSKSDDTKQSTTTTKPAKPVNTDSLAVAKVNWKWQVSTGGSEVGYAQINIFSSTQSISIVKYDPKNYDSGIYYQPASGASTTDVLATRISAEMAVNGSYFDMTTKIAHTFFSYKHNIVSTSPVKELYRSNGLLAFNDEKGTVLTICQYDTTMLEHYRNDYYSAIASGPILILDGVIPTFAMDKSFYYTRNPRTFVGVDKFGKRYFVVVDGRFPGQGEGMAIDELAIFAKYLGLVSAINLDGGGSSTLWTKDFGVINYPSDNKQFDHFGLRVVPDIIYAKPK